MNPKISIGKLRNAETGKGITKDEVRDGYSFESVDVFTENGETYRVYHYSGKTRKPVPDNGKLTKLNPPIWKGKLQEAPVTFYKENGNGQIQVAEQKALAGLHRQWGEGFYQVLRYPDKQNPRISNIIEPVLVVKE